LQLVITAVAAYLLGSLSFARLVSGRLAPDVDPFKVTLPDPATGKTLTHHLPPRATTASMALGWQGGCLIAALDMAKALVPVLVLRYLYPTEYLHLVAAVFVVVGNNWPLYHGFRGGNGLSAIYGGLLAIDPLGMAITLSAGFVVGLIVFRSMLLTLVLPVLLLLPWFWWRTGDLWYVAYAVALLVLYFITVAADVKAYMPRDKDGAISERAAMEQMPMGRGMLKILDKLGLKKER